MPHTSRQSSARPNSDRFRWGGRKGDFAVIICCLLSLGMAAGNLFGQVDKTPNLKELPEISPDFEARLFAKEPLVRNACSLAFDSRGRMFVGQGPQYRTPTPSTPGDSVVILEDTDGDGVADKVRTFATGFNCIQGLAWHGKDLWVANAPDLTIVRDTDGDDVADEYIRVFTDLGNIEHALHGLNWAPDGRLYMSKGNSKGVVIKNWKKDEPDRIAPKPFRELWGVPGPPDAPDFPPPRSFTRATYKATYQDWKDDWGRMGGILRCEDMGRGLEIVARGYRNAFGLGVDASFDWLGVDQDQSDGDRLFMPFYGANFGWAHAWSGHWTGENHLPTVPISAPVIHGSLTGVLYADAPNWPDKFRGVWIINDWLLKKTYLHRPDWKGALMQPQGGRWEDFIIGSKALYRPVDLAFGPDGALFIIGWGSGYGVEWDKEGNMTNEGRIFRIMPKGASPLPPPGSTKPPGMSVTELIAEFGSVLPVRRIDAQDELVRRGNAAAGDIRKALAQPGLSTARETWSLWTLARIGGAGAEGFMKGIAADPSAQFNRRLQAVRALGFLKSAALPELLPALLASSEPRLRFAAIQAAHQANSTACVAILTNHAATESERICYFATWRALRDLGGAPTLEPLLADTRGPVRCAALLGLRDLGPVKPELLAVLASDMDESVRTVAQLAMGRPAKGPEIRSPAKAPAPGKSGPESGRISPITSNLRAESARSYTQGTLKNGERAYTDRSYVFTKVPESLDGAEMIRTANDDDDTRGNSFLTFDLAMESTVFIAHDRRIAGRPEWMKPFADTDLALATDHNQFHLWSQDFPAGKVSLGGSLVAASSGTKSNYFVIIKPKPLVPPPALTTAEQSLAALAKADARRGEALFFNVATCSICHRVGNRGTNFGPDLTNLGARMEAKYIVQSLLEPNAVITEGFAGHSVEAGGKSYFGILLSAGPTLRIGLVTGQVVEIPENTIKRHEILPVSPMPPQSALLKPQDVADITAWLMTAKQEASSTTQPTALPKPAPAKPSSAAPPSTAPSATAPSATAKPADSSPLTAVEKPDRLVIMQSGGMIGEFVFSDPKIRRPFFANLRAPGGIPVTRTWPPVPGVDAVDHADMHPGVWLAFGNLAGHDFWRNKGTMKHESFAAPPAWKGDRLEFSTISSLLTSKDTKLAAMRSDFSIAPKGGELHLTWAAAFTPEGDGFYFGDQEEMGLGVRMATPLIEKSGGRITASTGKTTANATWGQPAEWCDYSGTINGIQVGAKIIPDPANFRPSWWHNRDYGVFVANPFGRGAMKQGKPDRTEVKKGETFRMKFTIILHAGKP